MSETPMRLSQVSVPLPPSLRSWVAAQGLRRRAPGSERCQIRHLFAGARLGISIDIFLPPLRLHKMSRRMGCNGVPSAPRNQARFLR